MLTIRFNRIGKRNRAQFRIVAQEHTIAPNGKHVEILGSYDPHLKKSVLKVDQIKKLIEKGVNISDSVYNLLVKEKVIEGKKRAVKMPHPKKEEAAPAEAVKQMPVAEPAKVAVGEVKKEEQKTDLPVALVISEVKTENLEQIKSNKQN